MPTNRKFRAQKFILKSKEKYEGKFNYSLVNYKNKKTEVVIVCLKHGPFSIKPQNLLSENNKTGCYSCKEESRPKAKTKKAIQKETNRCNTNNFNVLGGTKKHQHLLLSIFK